MTKLSRQPWLHWPETAALIAAFAMAKQEMRFVGGCVRDSLLGREVKDIDVATPVLPDAVTALLERAGIRAIPTGIDHGTVTALIGKKPFEITTLRRDVATDGRHAEVEYTDSWQADAARRDFTINALYASADGELFDYFGGMQHLQPLRIMFIGDAQARISEDALRILRFFRFTAQLGAKEYDAPALQACTEKAPMIAGLSGERIAQEMLKLLASTNADAELLQRMNAAGVVRQIGLPAPPVTLPKTDALSRVAFWLMQGGDAAALRERWKLSGAQATELKALMHTATALQPGISEREQKKLLRAMGKDIFIRAARMVQDANAAALAERWQIPQFPVTGADLLAQGYTEGKPLGEKLKALEAAWEAEDYKPSCEELLKRI